MTQDFWNNIFKYREYGFEPLSWLSDFSNNIDLELLEASLNRIKGVNLKFAPDWIDYLHKNEGKGAEITRRIYRFIDSKVEPHEIGIKKALAVLQLSTDTVENQDRQFDLLSNFINSFKCKCLTKKITAVNTSSKNQFALLDFIETRRGNKVGYILANNYITQVTDILEPPESEIHCKITVAGAIENLNLLGCTSEFKIFPVYDAPSEELLDWIRKNFDLFTITNNIFMEDYSALKIGSLFFGATATATTFKEIPNRYNEIEEGMNIIVTDKFGTIVPLTLFLLTKINEENIQNFEKNGIAYDMLVDAKDKIMNNLSHPRFELGKIISKYCPDFEEKFDRSSHITAVYPVLTQGILAVKKLSTYTNSEIIIKSVPIKNQDISKYAVKELFVKNGTASINGCHLIIADNNITDLIIQDLKKIHLEPEVIGNFGKLGKTSLNITDNDIENYLIPKSKLYRKIISQRPKDKYIRYEEKNLSHELNNKL